MPSSNTPSTDLTVSGNRLGLTTRQARKLQQGDMAEAIKVHEHRREARRLAACAEADIEAVTDVSRVAMTEELGLADEGIARAAGSSLQSRKVVRTLQRQEVLIDRIVRQAFGGW